MVLATIVLIGKLPSSKNHIHPAFPKSSLENICTSICKRSGARAGRKLFGTGLRVSGGAKVLGGSVVSRTRAVYQEHRENFVPFFHSSKLIPTVAPPFANTSHFCANRICCGQEIRPYSAAIADKNHWRIHVADISNSSLETVNKTFSQAFYFHQGSAVLRPPFRPHYL